ncbi:MAG: class I SAM-dependent methyltransferase [Candidatus Cloacimonetes bacterium]|nr:class I SAM-dependent methyltransferase [Candidatus Cloacimonadota bacterium]
MAEMNTLNIQHLENYSKNHTKEILPILEELSEYTNENTYLPQMMVGKLEGKFLQLICCLTGAKTIVEIGTFTGYSSLCIASSLSAKSHLYTMDCNKKTSQIAYDFAQKAKLDSKITFMVGKASEMFEDFNKTVDLVFIDADKTSYDTYYEIALKKLKPGGFILLDNMLWSGEVIDPKSEDAIALDNLNKKILKDERVENFLLPLRDGIQIVQKL